MCSMYKKILPKVYILGTTYQLDVPVYIYKYNNIFIYLYSFMNT